MTKLAPEWVRTNDPVIRSPARYRWTTAPAYSIYRELSKDMYCKHCAAHWLEQLSCHPHSQWQTRGPLLPPRTLVRAVKGLISQAGMVSICPVLWQRDVKLQQTNKQATAENVTPAAVGTGGSATTTGATPPLRWAWSPAQIRVLWPNMTFYAQRQKFHETFVWGHKTLYGP